MELFKELGELFYTSAFAHNLVVGQMLGLCPFLGLVEQKERHFSLHLSSSIIIILAGLTAYFVKSEIVSFLGIDYLFSFVVIICIGVMVMAFEALLALSNTHMLQKLGVYVPLMASNCAILATGFFVAQSAENTTQALVLSCGYALGYSFVFFIMQICLLRPQNAFIPKIIQGKPVVFFLLGFLSLIYSSL